MSSAERSAWDERFRTGDHASPEPDPLLSQLNDYAELSPEKRRALDLACGAGRNAVWLAEHGWSVTACDISLEGLRRARALADSRRVRLDLLCIDLEAAVLPAARFDLLMCFFYLQRDLFPQIRAALRPGGVIVYKTYTTEQLAFTGGPRHLPHLLQPQELLKTFHDFRILWYRETVKDRGVAELIAQRPR